MKVVVIGEPHFVKFWELIGAEGIIAKSDIEILREIKSLLEQRNIGLIIVPERLSGQIQRLRKKRLREGNIIPVFAFMPDRPELSDKRLEEIKKMISLAIGVELEL